MSDGFLHNSRALGLFDQVLHDARSTMRIVEIAGRGIVAEARCHLAMPQDAKGPNREPQDVVIRRALALAGQVEELCAIEDDLAALWSRRQAGTADAATFEAAFLNVVVRFEQWPQRHFGNEAGFGHLG
jgi:hypothetical protein